MVVVMSECVVCDEGIEVEGCGKCEECVEGMRCRDGEVYCEVCRWFVELVGEGEYGVDSEVSKYSDEEWDEMWEWLNSIREGG
jgi:hypothetical protein